MLGEGSSGRAKGSSNRRAERNQRDTKKRHLHPVAIRGSSQIHYGTQIGGGWLLNAGRTSSGFAPSRLARLEDVGAAYGFAP